MREPAWKKEARKDLKNADQGTLFKAVEGPNIFRLLPNKKGKDHKPYKKWNIHREVGPDAGFCRCGLDVAKSCWLCSKLQEIIQKQPAKQQLVDKMSRETQVVTQICTVEPGTDDYSAPIAWWSNFAGNNSMGYRIVSLITDTTRYYDNPKRGFNVLFKRTGTGMKTRYSNFEPEVEPTAIPKSAVSEGYEFLEDLIPAYSAEEQKSLFLGKPRANDEEAVETGEDGDEWGDSYEEDPVQEAGEEADEWEGEDVEDAEAEAEYETEDAEEAEEIEYEADASENDWDDADGADDAYDADTGEAEEESDNDWGDWESKDKPEPASEPAPTGREPKHPPAKKAPAKQPRGRKPVVEEEPPKRRRPPEKKASAKRPPAKRPPAKKVAAKRAPAKKVAAKRTRKR